LQLLPTELNAQSTLQIESDLILSAVLTGHSAQLATDATVNFRMINMIRENVLNQLGTSQQMVDQRGRPFRYFYMIYRVFIGNKGSKRTKVAKIEGWSLMDLPVKWHFSKYKFDMK